MLRVIALVAVVCGAGWYYFVGGARLDEAMVRQFYLEEAHATLARDPDALCKLLARKSVVNQETLVLGQTISETLNRQQACEAQRKTFQLFDDLGEKAGGTLTIEYDYNIDKLEIAPNRKSATVEVSSTLKMGEAFVQIRSVSTDQLNREWGQVRILRADAKAKLRLHLAAMQDPAKYFRVQPTGTGG